jgi:hypothetical protein
MLYSIFYFFHRTMTNRNIFTTLNAAMEAARQSIVPVSELVIIPPDAAEVTDEEDVDDEHQQANVTDICGLVEIIDMDDDESEPSTASVPPQSLSQWSRRWPNFSSMIDSSSSVTGIRDLMVNAVADQSPIAIFNLMWKGVVNLIKKGTEKYARDKNDHSFLLNNGELERFFGVLVLSGYNIQPSQKNYWEKCNDLGVTAVQQAISRNRFLEIKKYLHVADNSKLDTSDKLTKIRPLLSLLNKNFSQFGVFTDCISIDESMIPYFGKFGIKMFIRGKPIRFGYKVWCLCSTQGYLFSFDVYTGKSQTPNQQGPLGPFVVKKLLSIISDPTGYKVYFDNFFTSPQLLSDLRKSGFRATGTIRENRIGGAPFTETKAFKKKERGYFETCFNGADDICVVRWVDSSPVNIASNFEGPEPLSTCSRWSAAQKKRIQVGGI